MGTATMMVRGANRALNFFLSLFLILVLFYGGYALWDTWRVYNGAKLDEDVLNLKPDGLNNRASFEELWAINPDICAWISINATRINYPVVTCENNNEYLNKNIRGEFELSGSVFLDCSNKGDFSDYYSIIYGHHMDGGVMFGDMDLFADENFFNKNHTGWLYLPDKTYKLYIFSYMKTHAADWGIYALANSEQDLNNKLAIIAGNSIYYRQPHEGERVLALSTCASADTNGRELLFASMTEHEGEVDELNED